MVTILNGCSPATDQRTERSASPQRPTMAQLKPPACLTSPHLTLHCTDCADRSVRSQNGLKSLSVLSRRSKATSHLRWPRNTIDVDRSIFCACGTINLNRGCCSKQALATLSRLLPRLMRAAERQRRRQEVDSRQPFTIRLAAGSCTMPDDVAVPTPYLMRPDAYSYAKTYAELLACGSCHQSSAIACTHRRLVRSRNGLPSVVHASSIDC